MARLGEAMASESHVGPPHRPSGVVIWIEGIPGSGKTTLAQGLAREYVAHQQEVEVLDGDEVRRGLSSDLGFSRPDREAHALRVAFVAQRLSRHSINVVVALITPYESSRRSIREKLSGGFLEVWTRCPLEICRKRDPKGLYARSREGSLPHLTGVDDPFETPRGADLVLDTDQIDVEECIRRTWQRAEQIRHDAVENPVPDPPSHS